MLDGEWSSIANLSKLSNLGISRGCNFDKFRQVLGVLDGKTPVERAGLAEAVRLAPAEI